MKAGAFTPAIQVTLGAVRRTSTRSMKAGAFTPAILQPAGTVVQPGLARSMKAGAFTPAIPSRRSRKFKDGDGHAQ